MKFAFLVHPIDSTNEALWDLDTDGELRRRWGTDLPGLTLQLHRALARQRSSPPPPPAVRVVDELTGLVSPSGAVAEGRIYQIPMRPQPILEDPIRALRYLEEAVDLAADWGASLVGLGALTGVVGRHGRRLAERGPIPVTTGNSLTVYASVENLRRACEELDIDLRSETVAVVGVPGSIATAVAAELAPECAELLLVARQRTPRAEEVSRRLGCELFADMPAALDRARVVVTATSSGQCLDQGWLRAGTLVLDVGVPADVRGGPERDDVLILTGGLSRLPQSTLRAAESIYVWFQQGVVPSCLAETMILALEGRAECWSIGQDLPADRVAEIGELARAHGIDFGCLHAFGRPLADAELARFRKVVAAQRTASGHRGGPRLRQPAGADGLLPAAEPLPPAAELGDAAATRYARHINPTLAAVASRAGLLKTFVRGEGVWLFDEAGRRHLDFVAGYGSVNFGHNHPRITAAVAEALRREVPGFTPGAVNPYAAALAEQLALRAPGDLDIVFFSNSGAEAVEAAVKLARAATGRPGLVSLERSYHGKTLGALSVTGNSGYQAPFGPLLPGCRTVPGGDLAALERVLAGRDVAAFLVEPIRAEGGMHVPPPDYLPEARELCSRYGTLLIADEVQTGLGRTGELFGVNHAGIEPDLMTLAKSLGGGVMPIGATLAPGRLWRRAYGTLRGATLHTSTFGGGSMACAAGLAALETLDAEGLIGNAAESGQRLLAGLDALRETCPLIRDVRGRGLLLGVEFVPLPDSVRAHWKGADPTGLTAHLAPGLDELIDSFASTYMMQALLERHGIFVQQARSDPRVLRIQPPLTVGPAEIDLFLSAFADTCRELSDWLEGFERAVGKTGLGHREPVAPAVAARGG